MEIEERIKEHEIARRKLNNKKYILEEELNRINRKIIFHKIAIVNLDNKSYKIHKEKL